MRISRRAWFAIAALGIAAIVVNFVLTMPKAETQPVEKAVLAAENLWLISWRGGLWSVNPKTRAVRQETPPPKAPVLDLCAQDNRLIVLSGALENSNQFFVSQWANGRWSDIASIPSNGDALVGLGCGNGGPVLLTSRRLVRLVGPLQSVQLSQAFDEVDRLGTRFLLKPDLVVVAMDMGEFGGGIARISRQSGRVEHVEESVKGAPCDGGCGPTSGIVPAPWDAECLVASGGLSHMSVSYGHVLLVCPDKIQRVYERPCRSTILPGVECSLPFVGLAADDRDVLIVSEDGLTPLGQKGPSRRQPLPRFDRYGPFDISFRDPRMVLVRDVYPATAPWNGLFTSRLFVAPR